MRRRELLSSVTTLSIGAFAGCVDTTADCAGGTDVRFEPVDADAIADAEATSDLAEMPTSRGDLAIRALEGDEPTIETIRGSPLGWLEYAEWNGRFYRLVTETVAKGRVSGPEYDLDRDREMDDEDVPSAETLSYAALPTPDRWRIDEALDFNVERVESMGLSSSTVAGYLDPDDQERSVLAAGVDEPFLEVGGHYVALERVGEGTTTAERFRYGAEVVAESAAEFADFVLERRGADLPDLDDDVRALLETARENDGSVSVCDHERDDENETDARARREAVDALEATLENLEPAVEADDDGTASNRVEYVRYEGEWHRIELAKWAV